MNCLNEKCPNDNDRDYPFCRSCEPTCHLTNPHRDCLCDSCRESRASEYPKLYLAAVESWWTEEGQYEYGRPVAAAA